MSQNRINEFDDEYTNSTFGFTEEITDENFYIPTEADYIDFGEEEVEEWDISKAKPGLWENIRKKKEREGKKYKPAKRGDKDRPDPEAWKKAQSEETEAKLPKKKMYIYKNPRNSERKAFDRRGNYKDGDVRLVYVNTVYASEYQGRKVKLGKPFRTPDGPKKMSVYVKNEKGNVVKVNFGDPNMEIKKDNPARRKSFRARHKCDNPGPRWKARYWSCKAW